MKNPRLWKHKKPWKTAAWSGICVTWGVLGPLVISSETTDPTFAQKEKGSGNDDGVAAASDADSIDLKVSSSSSLPEIVDSRRLTLSVSNSKTDWLNFPRVERSLRSQPSSTDSRLFRTGHARQDVFLDDTASQPRRADLEIPISQTDADPSQNKTVSEEAALATVALEEPTSKEATVEFSSLEELNRISSLELQPEIMPASASSGFQIASRHNPLNHSTRIPSRLSLPIFTPSRAAIPSEASEPLSVEAEASGVFSEEAPSHLAASPFLTVDNPEDSASVEPTMGSSIRLATSNDSISYRESAGRNVGNPDDNPSGLTTAIDLVEARSLASASNALDSQEVAEPLITAEALDSVSTTSDGDSPLTPSDDGADALLAAPNAPAIELSLAVENQKDSAFNTDSICFKQLPPQRASATLASNLTALRASLRFDTPSSHRLLLEESLPMLAPGHDQFSQRMRSKKACTMGKRLRRMQISQELETAALDKG